MGAIFVVPTLVSESVPERMVPMIAKLVERNIAINYRNIFKQAIDQLIRDGVLKTQVTENMEDSVLPFDMILEATGTKSKGTNTKQASNTKDEEKKDEEKKDDGRSRRMSTDPRESPTYVDIDKVQAPRGVTFYTNISFEPTMIEFMIEGAVFTIGIKCIPFTFTDMDNVLISLMKYGKRGIFSSIRRSVRSFWNKIKRKLIPFTKAKHIYHGRPSRVGHRIWRLSPFVDDPGMDPTADILYAPDFDDLTKVNFIAKRMADVSSATTWATVTVMTTNDIERSPLDIETFYKSYKRLVNVGWGDIIIIDTEREDVHYCSLSLLSCTSMGFSYLRKLMNLDNVLDFSELSRFARGPFSKSPIRSMMRKL